MTPKARMIVLVLSGAALATVVPALLAFNMLDRRWPAGEILMEMQLGSATGLIDGSSDWDECAIAALDQWNANLMGTGMSFNALRGSSRVPDSPDSVNSVFWAEDIFGTPFVAKTVSVTITWVSSKDGIDQTVEADVVFNSAQTFNCYRGPSRFGPAPESTYIVDLKRLALHEFGHVLGLWHPDEDTPPQVVDAIMNAPVDDIDELQLDDIQGALTLYGVPVIGIRFPPRDQVLNFFLDLENEYRDTLGRSQTNRSFVDAEGSAVWFTEWLRYVLNDCSVTEAAKRVLLQIRGQGIQPVCGVVAQGVIDFPPRNESLDFLTTLDAFYRDELGRAVILEPVDLEGKAVWLQEYLRYRVNGVGEVEALSQVLEQIRDAVDTSTDDPSPHSPGPWEHRVFRATSTDGLNWRRDGTWLFDPASVPGAVMDISGNVFLYYVQIGSAEATEKLMVASSTDGFNFGTPIEVNMTGTTVTRRVDPNPVLLLDGSIRLYYLDFDVIPTKDIHSAISYDGVNFTAEEGIRFTKTDITDPDVFSVNDKWVMFVSQPTMGTSMTRATSVDGINFTEDPSWIWNNGGISSTFEFPGSVYRTYYCGMLGIQSATSTDGYNLTIEEGSRLTKPQGEVVCDPTIVELTPSNYIMYFKSFDDDRTADMMSEINTVP